MLLSLGVQLTTRCNLNCAHCFLERRGADIPPGLIERMLTEASTLGCRHLDLTGGEPTCHPDFEAILGLIVRQGYSFGLVTNGQRFGEVLPLIERYRSCLSCLDFSIEGADAAANDAMRGQGTFERVLRAMRLCAQARVPFSLRMTVTRRTVPLLDSVRAMAAEMGAQALMLIPLLPTPRTAEAGMLPTPRDLQGVATWALANGAAAGPRIVLTAGYFALDGSCPCPSMAGTSLFVTAQGEAAFCCHLAGYVESTAAADIVGDLKVMSLPAAAERARGLAAAIAAEKKARQTMGRLSYAEHHPCWYCLKRFRRVDWLRGRTDTTWGQDLETGDGAS